MDLPSTTVTSASPLIQDPMMQELGVLSRSEVDGYFIIKKDRIDER